MQIFATFEQTTYLEMTLTAIEQAGIQKSNILVVPLNNRKDNRKLFDTIQHSDGISLFDIGAALAVVFSVIFASRGFEWEWGPIYWGLIGAAFGFLLGFIIKLIWVKVFHKRKQLFREEKSEVIVVIECKTEQMETVEQILKHYFALGVGKLGDAQE
ncbi:hypothetical protein EPH95_11890 [Salicibibacter halophilus]|uniref:Uncharacterized protein n=1 Tax=Salicibibacter halophilus TaxID=2502791 RepID=A0A514LIW1_9BACI|nr:hypothetical protein [Salicibibacter halophilus]QDI91788.1 hypothetical protein EPH95_11890 [Salicibibacter halophilus]